MKCHLRITEFILNANFMATDLPGKQLISQSYMVAIDKASHSRSCYHSIHDEENGKGGWRVGIYMYTYVAQHL